MLREMADRRCEVAGAVLLAASFAVLLTVSEGAPSATRVYIGWFGAWAGLVLSIWPIRSWFLGRGAPVSSARSALLGTPPGRRIFGWLGFALVLRLLALGFEPALSDDVYRYVWDGRVVLAGSDPYATSPDDEALRPLRDGLWARTAHREVESVYPPLAQAAFALAAWFERPIPALRTLWLVVDLATCWLLFGLARRSLGSERTGLLYAWNPLVVVEGVGMGHVDVFGAFWLVLALRLGMDALESGGRSVARPRTGPTIGVGVALASGALVKLVPLVLIPLWAGMLRSGRLVAAAAVTLFVGSAPVWLGVGFPPGLLRYGVSWEFNGLLFEPLWRVLDGVDAADRVKALLAWSQRTYGLDPGPIYPYVYPQFLAKVLLGVALLVALGSILWVAWTRRRTPERAVALTFCSLAAATAVSATLYPWYLIWLAALLPLAPSMTLLVLCASMGFAYLPALTETHAFPTAWALVWLPGAVAAFAETWWRRRTPRTSRA